MLVRGRLGVRWGPREGPGLLLIDGGDPLLVAEEVQGRIEGEATGVHIGGPVQYEGGICIIIVDDRYRKKSLVEGRPLRLAIVHCLGVTNPG